MAFYHEYFLDTFKEFEYLFQGKEFNELEFNAGEFLPKEDSYRQKVFYLKSGRVSLMCSNSDGKVFTLTRMPQGNMIPFTYQTSDIFNMSESMSIQALSSVKAISFDIRVFKELVLKNPDFALACLNYSAKMNNLFQYKIMGLTVMDSKRRIFEMIYTIHLYGTSTNEATLNFTQEEIAEELGVSRIQLGRVLKELRDEGIISTKRNRIIIENAQALKEKVDQVIITKQEGR